LAISCCLFLIVLVGRFVIGFQGISRSGGVKLLEHCVGNIVFVVGVKEDGSVVDALGRGINDQREITSLGFGVHHIADFSQDVGAHPLALFANGRAGLSLIRCD